MLGIRGASRRFTPLAALALALPTVAHATWAPEGTLVGGGGHFYTAARIDRAPGGSLAVSALATGNAVYPLVLSSIDADGVLGAGSGNCGWESRVLPAADGAGGWWTPVQATYGGTTVTFRVVHRLANGTWDPAFTDNGVLLASDTYLLSLPVCAPDGAGGVLVAYLRNGGTAAMRGTFVQRFDATGAVAAGWPAGGRRITSEYVITGTLAVAKDGAGGAFALVSSLATGNVDLYRVLSTGALDPTCVGVSLAPYAPPAASANDLVLLSHGTSATAVFRKPGTSSDEIVAVRFDAASAPTGGNWTTTLLSSSSGTNLAAFADDAGGVYALWAVTSPSVTVTGAHVLADGSFASATELHGGSVLPAGAVFTSPSSGGRFAAGLDGTSGLTVAWTDTRTATSQILVRTLAGDGTVPALWPADGVTLPVESGLCGIDPGYRGVPKAACGDGAGGAYVAWDLGAYTPCLNPMRLARVVSPLVSGAPAHGAGTLALSAPAPNPSRGAFTLRATLPVASDARVELLDLGGRRVDSRTLSGAGEHVVRLGEGRSLSPGLYFARLVQGREASMVRVSIVH